MIHNLLSAGSNDVREAYTYFNAEMPTYKLWGRVASDVSALSYADSQPSNPFFPLPKNSNTPYTSAIFASNPLQATDSVSPGHSKSIQGGDSQLQKPADATKNTDMPCKSGPRTDPTSFRSDAKGATDRTKCAHSQGVAMSRDMFDLLKKQCPDHFKGSPGMLDDWNALVTDLHIMTECYSPFGMPVTQRITSTPRMYLGQQAPFKIAFNRLGADFRLLSVFFCLEEPVGTHLLESTQKAFDEKALESLSQARGDVKYTVKDVLDTLWFAEFPEWNTTVVTQDGTAGWLVMKPPRPSASYMFYGLLDTAKIPGYQKLPSVVQ
jgi:hypothetical protein